MGQYPGALGATVPVASNASPLMLAKGDSCYVVGVLKSGATQLPINEGNVAVEEFGPADAYNTSIAVGIAGGEITSVCPAISVEVHFDSAPGTFELDVQEADTDADAFYILPSTAAYKITTVNATTQNARTDLQTSMGKFIRVLLLTLTNDADCWVKITRLA